MKKGYHSTQRKIWGTIPASEFYGFVIGYAVAMILIGLFDWETTMLPIFLAFIGVGIGYWYDRKFFYVKDESEGEELSAGGEDEVGIPSAGERASDASLLAGKEADDASIQRQIRKSFDRLKDRDDDFRMINTGELVGGQEKIDNFHQQELCNTEKVRRSLTFFTIPLARINYAC